MAHNFLHFTVQVCVKYINGLSQCGSLDDLVSHTLAQSISADENHLAFLHQFHSEPQCKISLICIFIAEQQRKIGVGSPAKISHILFCIKHISPSCIQVTQILVCVFCTQWRTDISCFFFRIRTQKHHVFF